jgi:hypothetical protein
MILVIGCLVLQMSSICRADVQRLLQLLELQTVSECAVQRNRLSCCLRRHVDVFVSWRLKQAGALWGRPTLAAGTGVLPL